MISKENYQNVISRMMKKRKDGDLKKTDFVTCSYLFAILDTNIYKEIKQKNICQFTGLTKSDVSKSINRLKLANIIVRVDNEFESGFKFNMQEIVE